MFQETIAERDFRGHWWTLVRFTRSPHSDAGSFFQLDDLKTTRQARPVLADEMTVEFVQKPGGGKLPADVKAWASARMVEWKLNAIKADGLL